MTQVLVELNADGTEKAYYTRGTDLISQERDGKTSYYLYDGHGSVRMLADENGNVTDTYDYDAFANLINSTGNTANNYRYCGEQFDNTTGLYYLRARYMNPNTGTFIGMDSYSGSINDPVSLHKYLYANANPVMYEDPSGHDGELIGQITAISVEDVLLGICVACVSVAIFKGLLPALNQLGSLQNKIQEAISEILYETTGIQNNSAELLRDWIISEISDDLLLYAKVTSKIIEIKGKISDIKTSIPKGKVYQLAYISVYGGLIRLSNLLSYYEAIAALGVTGAINGANHAYTYNKEKSSDAQRKLEHFGTGDWGIYTHSQSAAKALALAFSWNEAPEVHGAGMYGHYHDSTHTFHIWFGGQIN